MKLFRVFETVKSRLPGKPGPLPNLPGLSTLSRLLLSQNLYYILVCLFAGVGIYMLSDLFDRLDDFIEAKQGFGTVLTYFLAKIPLMVSQILPAVFLLGAVAQLSLMSRNREILALQSCGISFARLARFFIAWGVAWCVIQLVFSQVAGVAGEQKASAIWAEKVRQRQLTRRVLKNVWFKQGDYMVEMKEAWPVRQWGRDITVYQLSEDRRSLVRIIRADEFQSGTERWRLVDVEVLTPQSFEYEEHKFLDLALTQDIASFVAIDPRIDPASLPLWKLSTVIENLEASGSNVEGLKTVWHMKLAYAFSLVSMSLVALTLVSYLGNIYLNIGLSLLITFVYYGIFVLGVTAGQKGLVLPWLGAWMANIIVFGLGALRLAWLVLPSRGWGANKVPGGHG